MEKKTVQNKESREHIVSELKAKLASSDNQTITSRTKDFYIQTKYRSDRQ
jgi:hypothetical protein